MSRRDLYEFDINEETNFEKWEYESFFKYESRENVYDRKRKTAKDLDLYKSDFENDIEYMIYLVKYKK